MKAAHLTSSICLPVAIPEKKGEKDVNKNIR